MRRWMVFLTLLVLPSNLAATQATTGRIEGIVLGEGEPIAFANVFVLGTRIGTMTDTAGRFTLVGVPVGRSEIQAQAIGYRKATRVVEVARNNRPVLFSLASVVLFATRPACEPYFAVEPYQGDRAVPKGAIAFCYTGEVDRASSSDSCSTLQIESIQDRCQLDIWWQGPPTVIAVRSDRGDAVRLLEVPAGGRLRWDGTDASGRPTPAGTYRLVAVTGRELFCERVLWRGRHPAER